MSEPLRPEVRLVGQFSGQPALADVLRDHVWLAAAPWPDGADALWPDRLAERLLHDARFRAPIDPVQLGEAMDRFYQKTPGTMRSAAEAIAADVEMPRRPWEYQREYGATR